MIKLKPRKRIKRFIQKYKSKKANSIYEDASSNVLVPNIIDMNKAIDLILNKKMSMARFGDGEFEICLGNSLDFQEKNNDLSIKLKSILKSKDSNLLIGLPNIFSSLDMYVSTKGIENWVGKDFWRYYLTSNNKRQDIYSILDFDKQYIDSFITRPYMDYIDKVQAKNHFENIKRVWNGRDIVFVEGEFSRLGIGNDLFNSAKSIKRITCPAKHAFSKYDDIIKECKKQDKEVLFLIALGPTATVLASDLSSMGFQALDIGHIDIEYSWLKQLAVKKIAIDNKYTSEASETGGRNINEMSKFNNEVYISQIIKSIK